MSATARRRPCRRPEQDKGQAKRLNRYDSPWLNAKFIVGTVMVVSIVLMGLVGQLFWRVEAFLSGLVAAEPAAAWAPGYGEIRTQAEVEAAKAAAATPTPKANTSLTGGNPFAKKDDAQAGAAAGDTAAGAKADSHGECKSVWLSLAQLGAPAGHRKQRSRHAGRAARRCAALALDRLDRRVRSAC